MGVHPGIGGRVNTLPSWADPWPEYPHSSNGGKLGPVSPGQKLIAKMNDKMTEADWQAVTAYYQSDEVQEWLSADLGDLEPECTHPDCTCRDECEAE